MVIHIPYFTAAPELKKIGEIDLGLASPVSDLAVDNTGSLWVVLPEEKRLLKSQPLVSVSNQILSSQWQEIALPPNTTPIEVLGSWRLMFLVLDVENKRLLVYSPDGNLIFTVGGLDGLNFHRDGKWMGDIVAIEYSYDYTFSEKIYVMDAYGKVVQFDTIFLDESDPFP